MQRRQSGSLLIVAIALIVVIAGLVVSLSFLAVSDNASSGGQAQSGQALNAANAGIESATRLLRTGTACISLPITSTVVSSTSSFVLTPTLNNPASTTVGGAGVTSSATTIPATSTTGYAAHGRLVIDGEQILYTGKTGTSFTGATRGFGGTAAAAHLAAATIAQNQCTVRATGSSGLAKRVIESAVQVGFWTDFLDGASTAVSNAIGGAAVGTLATSLPLGDNLIVAVVSLNSTVAAAFSTIAAGNLQLRRGVTTLASNFAQIAVGGGAASSATIFPQKTHFFVYRDAAAAANPTYSINAEGSTANINAQVKLLVINGPPNSSFQPTASGAASNTPGTPSIVFTHNSTVPAGDNIVIAAVQWDNAAAGGGGNRTIASNDLRLVRGGTTLASNQFTIAMSRSGRVNANGGMLLVARDPGATASPTYTVEAAASGNNVTVEAKLIVISGLGSAFLDGGSATLLATATSLLPPTPPLATALPVLKADASNVVIAATQYDNTVAAARTIAAGAEDITLSGTLGSTAQASNPYQISLCSTATGPECTDFAAGLLWRQTLSAGNPSFDVQSQASAAASITGEAKILGVTLAPTADRVEIFP